MDIWVIFKKNNVLVLSIGLCFWWRQMWMWICSQMYERECLSGLNIWRSPLYVSREKFVVSPEDQVMILIYIFQKNKSYKSYAWTNFHLMLSLNIRVKKMQSQGARFQFRSSLIVRHQQFLILNPWYLKSQPSLFWRRACSAPVVKSEETPVLIGYKGSLAHFYWV